MHVRPGLAPLLLQRPGSLDLHRLRGAGGRRVARQEPALAQAAARHPGWHDAGVGLEVLPLSPHESSGVSYYDDTCENIARTQLYTLDTRSSSLKSFAQSSVKSLRSLKNSDSSRAGMASALPPSPRLAPLTDWPRQSTTVSGIEALEARDLSTLRSSLACRSGHREESRFRG